MNKTVEHYTNGDTQYRCSSCGKIYISPECAEACCSVHEGTCAEGFHSLEHERLRWQDIERWRQIQRGTENK